MYTLIDNILNIPSQYANSTVTYIAGVLLLLVVVTLTDFVYKFFRSIIKSIERR